MSATSTDPAGARVTATWMARLSPGLHRSGYARPATRAPGHAGFTRGCMRRAPDSPSVAAPNESASDPSTSVTGGSADLAQGVAVGVGERLGELVHLQHGRLVIRPAAIVVDGDGDVVAQRGRVLREVLVLADRVVGLTRARRERERRRVGGGGATREDGDATRHDEAAHDLTGRAVPEPVAHLGVERVVFFAAPHRRLVVEAVEVLVAVVDGTEGLHGQLLEVRSLEHLTLRVRERSIETALVGLPFPDQSLEGAPFTGHVRSSSRFVRHASRSIASAS